VFQYYEEYMRAHNAIDFEDMLLHTKSLMEKRPDVRQRIRSTFAHVLIDEVRPTRASDQRLFLQCFRDCYWE
jgi:superfamily I DNA/RNA helicase